MVALALDANLNVGSSASEGRPAIDDDHLVRAFLKGDRSAFEQLVRRHQGAVHALARRYTRNADDAADLSQQCFVRAFEAVRRTFERDPSQQLVFRPWLLRIVINLAKNRVRDVRRWPTVAFEELVHPAPQLDALQVLERRRRVERVRLAVLGLPPRRRDVFALRVDAGLSFAELAETLGITENNAKVTFHQVVTRLTSLLATER